MATIISSKTTGGGGASITGDTSGILQLASADGTTALTLSAAQAATFVSSVTATSLTSPILSSATTLSLQTNGTTTAVTIDASQNVGIGITSPAQKLDVNGQIIIRGQASILSGYALALNDSTNANTYYLQNASNNLQFILNSSERMRIDSSGNVLVGTTTAYGGISTTSTIAPMATPSTNWGIDFAPSTSTPNYITLTAAATYDITTGSGIIAIHSNSTGDGAVFFTFGGNVAKIAGGTTIVAGVGILNQIGLSYNAGTGKYRINNGYATSQSIFISTIRTRTTT